ncbi:MAG: zinc ribbon domain-containing protein [Clostridia bacterium]|nr:zinc ribbon domain-containing protein [Clostridia bacterium]
MSIITKFLKIIEKTSLGIFIVCSVSSILQYLLIPYNNAIYADMYIPQIITVLSIIISIGIYPYYIALVMLYQRGKYFHLIFAMALRIIEKLFLFNLNGTIDAGSIVQIIIDIIIIVCISILWMKKKKNTKLGRVTAVKCNSCGEEIREGSSFCGKCGTKINELNELRQNVENEVSLSNACQNCGAKLADGANFCSRCGAICGEALRDKKKMMWWKIAIAALVIVSLVFIFVSINSAQPKNAIIGTWESDSDSISFSENGKFTQGVYYGTYTIYSDSTLELTYQDWDRFGSNRTYRFGLEAMNPGDDAYSYWYISDGYLYFINEVYTKQ